MSVSRLVARLKPVGYVDSQATAGRQAAVLALFSQSANPDLLFTERSGGLRKHSGQISFPGGKRDDTDADAGCTALRETEEEIGLPASAIKLVGRLPNAQLAVTNYDVAPMVGVWSGEEPLRLNPSEVAHVHRWPVKDLANPKHRVTWQLDEHTRGPAWQLGDSFLWGFTAYLVDALLKLGGWHQAWDETKIVAVPNRFSRDRQDNPA